MENLFDADRRDEVSEETMKEVITSLLQSPTKMAALRDTGAWARHRFQDTGGLRMADTAVMRMQDFESQFNPPSQVPTTKYGQTNRI
jgi:hypothetical protein